MQPNISKICADSLRDLAKNQYDTNLKAAHSHELVAAFFGYLSKNAMKAEKQYPISNLSLSDIIVMIPEGCINKRRKNLQGLSSGLPDSYTLGEAVYAPLFANNIFTSKYPPFRNFDKLATYFIENSSQYSIQHSAPYQYVVDVKHLDETVVLSVTHCYRNLNDELVGDGKTTITLHRVAGHIGYGQPKVSSERWTANARKLMC